MARDVEKTTPFVKDDNKPRSGGAAPGPYRDPSEKVGRVAPPMFWHFDAAKHRKLPGWTYPLIGSMLLVHVILFFSMWAKNVWDIEQLERPKSSVDLAIAPPPPPPPPPPKGGVKPKDVTITPKKIKVRDIVQPVKMEKQEVAAPIEAGDPNGVEGGTADGVVGGDLAGAVAAPPPPPPPPPPPAPQTVTPQALDANRVSGTKEIYPDDVTKTEINRSGKDKLVGTFKLCLSAEGNILSVTTLKPTGFPAYDSKIQSTIRGEWRYRPFSVNGKPQPTCSTVTFIYSQR